MIDYLLALIYLGQWRPTHLLASLLSVSQPPAVYQILVLVVRGRSLIKTSAFSMASWLLDQDHHNYVDPA